MSLEKQVEQWNNQPLIEEQARQHYRDDLPFHNFAHALDVRNNVRLIAQERAAAGDTIDPEEVEDAEIGAIWHDAGFYIPTHLHGMASKETLSAWIAANEQRKLGMPEDRIERMSSFILGTQLGVAPIGDGAKVLRRADLANVVNNDPAEIIRATIRLFKEDEILKRKYDHPGEIRTDLLAFIGMSYEVLTTYNQDDVSLGESDIENGQSRFTNTMEEKLECFLPPNVGKLLRRLNVLPKEPTT